MKKTLFISSLLFTTLSFSQVQIGFDIEPSTPLGQFGKSVSMSSNGNIVAATGGDINTGKSYVRVFQNISNVWTQLGSDITDVNSTDFFGRSISISAEGNIIAIGIPLRDLNGTDSGAVEIYENIEGTWTQMGSDILGQSERDRLGQSVSISADGNIVAIGVPESEETASPTKSGRVEIYKYINGVWSQIGSDVLGTILGNWFGENISLSSDGNTIAIAVSRNNAGQVQVYRNISNTWTQVGSDINGLPNDNIGESISLSSDGNIVAFGAKGNGFRGFARIYKNIDGVWTQIGSDILGEGEYDLFGSTISLSSEGNIVAIGSPLNSDNGYQSGHVRVFQNIDGDWIQIGTDIDGEQTNDLSAEKNNLSLSSDGSIVAIGAWQNRGSLFTAGTGHVRVFGLSNALSVDSFDLEEASIFPNPASTEFKVILDETTQFIKLSVYNTLGKYVIESNHEEVNIETLSKGIYFVKITSNIGEVIKKLIIK